jgi:hypothetical protein
VHSKEGTNTNFSLWFDPTLNQQPAEHDYTTDVVFLFEM